MGGDNTNIVVPDDPESLGNILGSIGSIFTTFIDMAGDVCATIVSTPLLMVGVAIPLAGAAIGFFNRLRKIR